MDLNQHLRVGLVVLGRRLVQQGALVHGIELQHLRHLRHRLRVILIAVQLLPLLRLEQGVDAPVLKRREIRAPQIRHGEISLLAGHKQLPLPRLSPGIHAEQPVLAPGDQGAVRKRRQRQADIAAEGHHPVSAFGRPGIGCGIGNLHRACGLAALALLDIAASVRGPQIGILSVRYHAALIENGGLLGFYYASVFP